MSERIFYIVDVFAENRYAGNQLAVFRNGDLYTDLDMQVIAKEMNYSETTFILKDETRQGGYDVRIFTPAEEVPFAGHPTLGTAYVIVKKIIQQHIDKIILNLKVGQIPVTLVYRDNEPETLWMSQKPPQFGPRYTYEEFGEILGLSVTDFDNRYPIQEVSTGLPFFIVPIKTLAAMKKAKVRQEELFALIKKTEAKAPLLFCPETIQTGNDLNVRVFVDYYNVPEDPATGSANGCLAGYLVKHRYFGGPKIDVRVEQGYEIGRPSILLLDAQEENDTIQVKVGGKVFLVAEGRLADE